MAIQSLAAQVVVTDVVDRTLGVAKAAGADRCLRADQLPKDAGALADAVGDADVVNVLRIQQERLEGRYIAVAGGAIKLYLGEGSVHQRRNLWHQAGDAIERDQRLAHPLVAVLGHGVGNLVPHYHCKACLILCYRKNPCINHHFASRQAPRVGFLVFNKVEFPGITGQFGLHIFLPEIQFNGALYPDAHAFDHCHFFLILAQFMVF